VTVAEDKVAGLDAPNILSFKDMRGTVSDGVSAGERSDPIPYASCSQQPQTAQRVAPASIIFGQTRTSEGADRLSLLELQQYCVVRGGVRAVLEIEAAVASRSIAS
jgi:hypothetical protein